MAHERNILYSHEEEYPAFSLLPYHVIGEESRIRQQQISNMRQTRINKVRVALRKVFYLLSDLSFCLWAGYAFRELLFC